MALTLDSILLEGDQLGTYKVESLIGEGGMASVYKAWHTGLHRFEAIKVPYPQSDARSNAAYVERLLHEARTAAHLHHPHIVAIHNVSESDDLVPYFAMEYVPGCNLAQLLHARGRLSTGEALHILKQVASALDYAHLHDVIHRDVKPANILLCREHDADSSESAKDDHRTDTFVSWEAKVADFGISRAGEESGGTRLTRSGITAGTPEYMSPEQAGSGEPVTYRTDLYSLAVVAYEMLCGTPPFTAGDGVSRISILLKHLDHTPKAPNEYDPILPRTASEVILKGLAKKTTDRFANCSEFVSALRSSLEGAVPTKSFDVAITSKLRFPARQHHWPIAAAVCASVLTGLFIHDRLVSSAASPGPPANSVSRPPALPRDAGRATVTPRQASVASNRSRKPSPSKASVAPAIAARAIARSSTLKQRPPTNVRAARKRGHRVSAPRVERHVRRRTSQRISTRRRHSTRTNRNRKGGNTVKRLFHKIKRLFD